MGKYMSLLHMLLYNIVMCLQVLYEFDLMFPDDNMASRISNNWEKMVPKLCELGNIRDANIEDQEIHFRALKLLETKLKKGNQGTKQASVLSVFEVHFVTIVHTV